MISTIKIFGKINYSFRLSAEVVTIMIIIMMRKLEEKLLFNSHRKHTHKFMMKLSRSG